MRLLTSIAIAFLLAAPLRADKTEWTESGNTKTKTVYDEAGNLVYQAVWSKETGQLLGEPLDLRKARPAAPAAPEPPGPRFANRGGRTFLAADSLVKIRFDADLHSGRHKRGRKFGYTLLEDVRHDGRVVLAKGTRGQGVITSARRRGMFGKSGRLELDFGAVPLAGGGEVRLALTERSREANKQTAIAAGTSGAGLLVLGPIGLAGGAFIKGRDAYIKKGSTSWVSVLEDAEVR